MGLEWAWDGRGMGHTDGWDGLWSRDWWCMVDGVRVPAGPPDCRRKNFPASFPASFFPPKKKKKKKLGMEWNVRDLIVCALVRLWLGFVRL